MSNKKEDPAIGLFGLWEPSGKTKTLPFIKVGRVTVGSPLQISSDELVLESKDLYINESLLNHSRNMTYRDEPGGKRTDDVRITTNLKLGDLVAILATEDKQRWVVLCKVV